MEAKHDANLKRIKSETEMEYEKKFENQIDDYMKRHSIEDQRKNDEYKKQLAQVSQREVEVGWPRCVPKGKDSKASKHRTLTGIQAGSLP